MQEKKRENDNKSLSSNPLLSSFRKLNEQRPTVPRRGRGVICFPIISTTESHLHVYYHLYTDILHSMTHKIIALHMLNSIQI